MTHSYKLNEIRFSVSLSQVYGQSRCSFLYGPKVGGLCCPARHRSLLTPGLRRGAFPAASAPPPPRVLLGRTARCPWALDIALTGHRTMTRFAQLLQPVLGPCPPSPAASPVQHLRPTRSGAPHPQAKGKPARRGRVLGRKSTVAWTPRSSGFRAPEPSRAGTGCGLPGMGVGAPGPVAFPPAQWGRDHSRPRSPRCRPPAGFPR